ncbi:RDD family protein [Longispora sp. NPDC051575]|uniref:RDD family protein n=1 Tax=Longispora sp. NPDC051575 TaxID=3154943 RepID=UPI00343F3F82
MAKNARGSRIPAHKRPKYAHWVLRAAAYLIDVGIVALVLLGAVALDRALIGGIVGLVLVAANRWYLGGRTGQTVGRRLLRIRLASVDSGEPIGPWRALLRDVAHLFDTVSLLAGWFFPIWDAQRQTFADKLLRTHVTLVR